jgi:hypothetical protein
MQITFSQDEFVSMLSNLFKTPIQPTDVQINFNETTGDISGITISGLEAVTLLKIGSMTQAVAPVYKKVSAVESVATVDTSTKEPLYSVEEEDEEPKEVDELDKILEASQALAMLPNESRF